MTCIGGKRPGINWYYTAIIIVHELKLVVIIPSNQLYDQYALLIDAFHVKNSA